MQCISPFLVCGENGWWTQTEHEYNFCDSDHDPEHRLEGPALMYFSQHMLPDVLRRHAESWNTILEDESIVLPAPFIRLYDKDGNLTGTRSYSPLLPQQSQSRNTQDLSCTLTISGTVSYTHLTLPTIYSV